MFSLFCVSLLVAVTSGQIGFFAVEGPAPASLEDRFASLVSHVQDMDRQIAKLQRQVSGLEQAAHRSWNSTDSGSLYKVFEQRKTWADAESHCQSFDAHLAVIDSEAKNNYVKGLIREKPSVDYAWIGMKTTSSRPSQSTFSNFGKENPIDGCAVMDKSGVCRSTPVGSRVHSCVKW